LRAGGIKGNDVGEVLDHMTQKMLREVLKGVRLPLSTTPPGCSDQVAAHFIARLREREPLLASFLEMKTQASAKLLSGAWKNATGGV
jgi:hypothetical protein